MSTIASRIVANSSVKGEYFRPPASQLIRCGGQLVDYTHYDVEEPSYDPAYEFFELWIFPDGSMIQVLYEGVYEYDHNVPELPSDAEQDEVFALLNA